MNRRSGATLVEVLVAIFVMAIGLLAMLTLFPLGALSMAQALKDNRCAIAAANAEALATVRDLRNDEEILQSTQGRADFYTHAGTAAISGETPYEPVLNAGPDGPSYPVYLDPIGWVNHGSGGAANPRRRYVRWLGGENGQNDTLLGTNRPFGIPRRAADFVLRGTGTPLVRALRSFSLLDDVQFEGNGIPTVQGPSIQRNIRYTWAYLLRRPRNSIPSVVDMTVVVYSQRAFQFDGMSATFGEATYRVQGSWLVGSNTVQIKWRPGVEEKPIVRRGTWILDTTEEKHENERKLYGPIHGIFYRVVGVSDPQAGTDGDLVMTLELQTRLKAPVEAPEDNVVHRRGRITVMEHVAEVFEKGPGWKP